MEGEIQIKLSLKERKDGRMEGKWKDFRKWQNVQEYLWLYDEDEDEDDDDDHIFRNS